MKTDMIPQAGKKQSGEETGLPKQNTRANLNDTSARKSGGSTAPAKGNMAEKGYNRESM